MIIAMVYGDDRETIIGKDVSYFDYAFACSYFGENNIVVISY